MNTHSQSFEVLNQEVNWQQALVTTARRGYAFVSHAISFEACQLMEEEVEQLIFEDGDYTAQPITEYKSTKVTQRHERFYRSIADPRVTVAALIGNALIRKAREVTHSLPQDHPVKALERWAPTEVGYQRYYRPEGHISPHRDRRSDQLLGATMTINGAALVKIYRPLGELNDYTNLESIDEFETTPCSLMLLRASGLGSGEQAIHEVFPPRTASRLILNLRMRPDVLKSPSEEHKP